MRKSNTTEEALSDCVGIYCAGTPLAPIDRIGYMV
jgi:hypothetical protein